jgi:HlyD family secretion protein
MKKNTIIFTVIILTVLGFVAFILPGLGKGVDLAGEIETESIKRGTLSSVVEADGIVQSNQSALLFWKIPGKVGDIPVKPGDRVRAGDILASLDPISLPSTIIAAQAELLSAQKALKNLKNSEIQRAQAQKAMDEAQKALEDARFPQALQAQALLEMAEAGKAVEEAQRNYKIVTSQASQSAIDQAYANLLLAENKVSETEDTLDRIEKYKVPSTYYGFKIPADLLSYLKSRLRKINRQMEYVLVQDVLAYENSLERYNALLEPPDPVEVAAASAELATAKAQLAAAELEWEEVRGGFSPAEIAVLEARLEDARREWLRVKDGPDPDDITLLETQIAAYEAAIQQTKITAPFNGTVTKAKSQVKDLVNTGAQAFQLDDLSYLHVDLAVTEIDINRIKLGQKATITFDSVLDQEYQGEVTDIALVGTEIYGATSFMVRVELLNADAAIKPGMTATVNIIVSEVEDVLLVPSQAIRALNGNTVVYRWVGAPAGGRTHAPDDSEDADTGSGFRFPLVGQPAIQNQFQPVTITLGATSGKVSEVVSGDLQVGDVIVLNPPTE